ncbi:hypothetical protein COO60DRAFT_1520704 [Scenedesmus sp. NREL 46B-D3]|nr:hypothetical protein COO60DRAFT_1520704 [Scenedesmus sp. NREL 46B-D3]
MQCAAVQWLACVTHLEASLCLQPLASICILSLALGQSRRTMPRGALCVLCCTAPCWLLQALNPSSNFPEAPLDSPQQLQQVADNQGPAGNHHQGIQVSRGSGWIIHTFNLNWFCPFEDIRHICSTGFVTMREEMPTSPANA